MPKMTDILSQGKHTLSVELVPSRNGTPIDTILESASNLKNAGADFFSVTKGAGGSLRGGTLPISYFIKEKVGLEVISHYTCIDKKCTTIECDLLDLHFFGVKNILALRGDLPDITPGVKSDISKHIGDYDYAHQLVTQIKNMNEGKYLLRKGFDKENEFRDGLKTDFCIGVAAHPEEKNMDTAIEHLKAKVDSGAEYAITQMIFDPELYKEFVGKAKDAGCNIPILPGIRPLKSHKWAVMCEEKFGVPVPQKYTNGLEGLNDEAAYKKSVEMFSELCTEFKDAGAPGVHIFAVFDVDLVLEILRKINQ